MDIDEPANVWKIVMRLTIIFIEGSAANCTLNNNMQRDR